MIGMQEVKAQFDGPPKSTQWQRLEIIKLLKRAEFSTSRVTLMHRRVGAPDSFMDQPIDAWLSSLTQEAANGVIHQLQKIVA